MISSLARRIPGSENSEKCLGFEEESTDASLIYFLFSTFGLHPFYGRTKT